jgi:hypothetical protein
MAASFAPGDPGTIASLGFDATATPPWLMIPVGGSKTVLLKEGAGLKLDFARSGVASFTELPPSTFGRLITITGSTPGTVRLEATGSDQATLEVTVKAQKKVSTFVHFVFDKSGRTTNKGLTEATQIIEVVNKLLGPQANVSMFRRDSGGFTLPFDLPMGVTAGDSNVEEAIASHSDSQSDYNIFFVQQVIEPKNKGVTVAYSLNNSSGRVRNFSIVPNIAGGQEVAHEFGHFLLNGATFLDKSGHPNGAPRDNLMTDVPNTSSIKIPKPQANVMNASGTP